VTVLNCQLDFSKDSPIGNHQESGHRDFAEYFTESQSLPIGTLVIQECLETPVIVNYERLENN
jgi:hypothetical protein